MQRQDNFTKYFWDCSENASEVYKLKRLFEYASFPDLLKISFSLIKDNIDKINIDKLRTGYSRKEFLKIIKISADKASSWEEAIFF